MSQVQLSDAIIALGGTNFSVRDIDTIHWVGGNTKNITKEQIQAKYDELVEEDKKIQYQRDRETSYPEIKEQLDLLYHDMTSGKGDKTGEWYKVVNKVKTDNPKP